MKTRNIVYSKKGLECVLPLFFRFYLNSTYLTHSELLVSGVRCCLLIRDNPSIRK